MANRHFFGRAALVTSLGLGMLGCNDGSPTTVPLDAAALEEARAAASVEPSVRAYDTGGSTLLVYESQYAGTNKATAVTWNVGADVEKVVRDMPGLARQ